MNSFLLKIFACFSMFLDHLGRIVTPAIYPLVYIGRFAFPIFAFQISEGVTHTKNIKKYMLRLLIFALISQIPFYLYLTKTGLNVFFTLLFGVIAIYIYKELSAKKLLPLGILAVGIIAYISYLLKTDYNWYGVLIIFLFYIAKNKKVLMALGFLTLTTIMYLIKIINFGSAHPVYLWQLTCTLLAIIPILLYNGKQGHKVKYAIYLFYPLHILILYLCQLAFF